MDIKLTQFSHGAGCGCKLSPAILDRILHSNTQSPLYERLLVGNDTRDDAAVYDLGDGRGLISTTDFFMPIVDDPYDFGRIASANAISDVYAMGGTPVLAIAILGWTIDKIPPEIAAEVIRGAREVCAQAGIPLAGGHSIDSPEPIFGLAVNGLVEISKLKKNSTAVAGSHLFLTKSLGVGILTTAEKNGQLIDSHRGIATASMTQINKIGSQLAQIPEVCAMTDVTGFGLLGHLIEMCDGSHVSAEVQMRHVPTLCDLAPYIKSKSTPGGTKRNWMSYGSRVVLDAASRDGVNREAATFESNASSSFLEDYDILSILCDPQTSGGLLVAVEPSGVEAYTHLVQSHGLEGATTAIGRLVPQREAAVYVETEFARNEA